MKITQAYQLGAVEKPVIIVFDKKNNVWYPFHSYDENEKELFIRGKGHIKINKWKKETLATLATLTAEGIKTVYDKYGLNVAMGMVKGWGNTSLFSDGSYGLEYVKYEVANMAVLGKKYDDFTDAVQKIGDEFVSALLNNGFTLQGDITKGTLWCNYKDENNYGSLVGFVGIYEKNHLHPLQYVEHSLHSSLYLGRILPQFNPMDFDNFLVTLFNHKYMDKNLDNSYEKADKMLEEIVSVRDRIAHLTNEDIANKIESIFDLQKELTA
jgi:hypothetical protein